MRLWRYVIKADHWVEGAYSIRVKDHPRPGLPRIAQVYSFGCSA